MEYMVTASNKSLLFSCILILKSTMIIIKNVFPRVVSLVSSLAYSKVMYNKNMAAKLKPRLSKPTIISYVNQNIV